MTKVGDVRVVPAKLGKGFVVEQLAFFNSDFEPTWVTPDWEKRGLGGLGNVFRSREKAQIAGLAWRRLPALDSRGSEMKTTLTDLKPKPERKPSPWAYTPEKTRFQLRRPIKAAPIPQTKKPTSMKPFLLMITGLLFCFTGVGLIIGIPMVLAGLAMGAYAIIGKKGVLIIGAILLGLYLLGSAQHAHAGEKRPLIETRMLAASACMARAAGPHGENADNAKNPLLMVTNACDKQTVAFVMACEDAGYPSAKCYDAIVGAGNDALNAAKNLAAPK